MSKYRFKTEEEFKRDGLWNKNRPNMWATSGNMNKYLGKDIPDKYNRFCDVNKDFSYEGWSFSNDDYVLKEIQPEYTVGKWYGCTKWDSGDFVKLERVYDEQVYFTECLNSGKYQNKRKNWWSFVLAPLFEADMSIVSSLLPDGHPDKIVSEETSFVLPSKWCIKLTEENVVTLGNWRSSGPLKNKRYVEEGWYLHTPKHSAKGYNEPTKDPDYTEITFEQFKQHILKESPVVESPKEIDMKDIQEEAKKRFPIGCKFIPVNSTNTYTLIEDSYTYTIHSKQIYAHDCHGTLYNNGKWATLVSLPESKEESIPEYVECIKSITNSFTVGKIYDWPYPIDDQKDRRAIPIQGALFSFKPSTKEAYDAQNTSKQLANKDLVKGEIYIYDGSQISTYPEGPSISIDEQHYIPNPKWMWCLPITHATEEQKALLRREIERNSKPDVMWHSDPIVEQKISTLSMKKQKFKIGDKVKIIQRKTSNRTGNCPGWDIANGNVGEIGVITYYSEPVRPYYVSQIGSDGYIGSFDEEDLELYQKEETTFYSNTELDFGRLDLEDWLRETKKLNLSLKKLTLHIEYGNTCNYSKVYNKLECEEDSPHSRAKYLYELWNSKLKKDFIEKEVIKETFIDNVQSVDVILRTKRKSIKF